MAYTIPQPIFDSYKTAHSLANGTLTAPATPELVAQWAVEQQMITPEQASEYLTSQGIQPTATSTTTTPSLTVSGSTGGLDFSGMTSGSPTQAPAPAPYTPIPATNVTPTATTATSLPTVTTSPTTTSVPSGTTSPGATGATAGAGAYDQLMNYYLQLSPGADVTSAQGQQAFNNWASGVMQQFNVGRWEDLPANFMQTLAPGTTAPAPAPGIVAPEGSNYNVVEGGTQTGGYQSTGSTNQTQTGNQTQTSREIGSTTGTQTQTGTQTGTETGTSVGTQAQTGATTGQTQVTAPFDINALVSGVQGAAQTDADRNAFLTDFMQTGGTQFGSQVDQAIRNSLTGPQMTGAGDSARARAAGYGAAEVARGNAGQRLQAAGALAGPSAAGTMASQFAPLYGQQTAGTQTGNTTSTGATTGASTLNTGATTNTSQLSDLAKTANTIDFQSLVGNESQSGTATGSSQSAGAGIVPESTPVKTGGCVVCTAYVSLGQMPASDVRQAVVWKLSQRARYARSVDGYMLYGPSLARLVLRSPYFARCFRPIARAILDHELYLSEPTERRWRVIPCITHVIFDFFSRPVGLFSRLFSLDTGVRCPEVRELLEKNNLKFEL